MSPTASTANASSETQVAVYQEVCKSYHALEDFRAKLLGFLPLASGAGIFFLLGVNGKPSASYLTPIGLVGAGITLGLLAYELRNSQLSRVLRDAGKELEESLLTKGQFRHLHDALDRLVGTMLGGSLVYAAVFAGWVYVALVSVSALWAWVVAFTAFLACLVVALVLYYADPAFFQRKVTRKSSEHPSPERPPSPVI